jgi:hypothetical protein
MFQADERATGHLGRVIAMKQRAAWAASFSSDADAVASDTTIDASGDGPAVADIVAQIPSGRPALHDQG